MRIDREAFLLAAISALAGCERADAARSADLPSPSTIVAEARPAVMVAREVAPELVSATPAPAPEPVTVAAPKVARRPLSAAKRWFFALSTEQRSNVKALCEERAAHPCAGMLARLKAPMQDEDGEIVEPEDPEEQFLAGMSTEQRAHANSYCRETSKMPAPTCETPLVVAFDSQPVEFTTAGRAQFAFVPAQPVATDWPTPATPWIARDLDHDGAITSGAELFGSATVLGGGTAANGFLALAALDVNADGTLDTRDPAFAELVLWSDNDGDHRSSADELRPLASVVTAIPLAHSLDPRCNARDACEGERGTLKWRDTTGTEHTGAVVDIYLPRR